MRIGAIVILIVAAILGGLLWASQHRSQAVVVSGVIEADEIRLGSRVGGRVSKVHFEEGQVIQQGDMLVELEPFDLTERAAQNEQLFLQAKAAYDKMTRGYRDEEKAQARAHVAQLKARLDELKNGPRKQEIQAAEADLAFAQAEQELSKQNLDRVSGLAKESAATKANLDQAQSEAKSAGSRVRARQEQLALLQEGTRPEQIEQAQAQVNEAQEALALMENGYRQEEIAEAYAAMQAADAARRVIQIQLAELQIRAPRDGIVEVIDLRAGDLVGANVPSISILDLSHMWIRAYVPENHLNLEIGDKLPITLDSYPGEEFSGRVSFIAREAEFTPSNVQTPEERSKQVFRIKVELDTGRDKLRPGMPVDLRLDKAAK
jgi:multidrug resistance efflux pump